MVLGGGDSLAGGVRDVQGVGGPIVADKRGTGLDRQATAVRIAFLTSCQLVETIGQAAQTRPAPRRALPFE